MTTSVSCMLPPQDLIAFWIGELDAAGDAAVEEHLFACADCTSRLSIVVELGAAIRGALLGGDFTGVLPPGFVARLKRNGVRVREYALEPGSSVDCTITRDDDLVVARLRAPLVDVHRLDVLIDDSVLGKLRLSDVAFDARAGGIVAVPSAAFLRTLTHARQAVQLVAVEGVHERVLADYTFNHFPSI